jgi:hypothetical protein
MDFKPTSIDPRPVRRSGGFGVLDFVVATAVGSLVLVAAASAFAFSGRSYAAIMNYSALDQQSRMTLDRMTKDVRMTRGVWSYYTNWVIFTNYSGSYLYYWWDYSSKTVYRWTPGSLEPMLIGCTNFSLDMRQRTPRSGEYEQFPVSINPAATCKLLNMSWICISNVLGTRVVSETVQSARVVMRNQ